MDVINDRKIILLLYIEASVRVSTSLMVTHSFLCLGYNAGIIGQYPSIYNITG